MNEKQYQLRPGTMLGNPEKRYKLEQVIGEGAFGITYKAYDTKLELQVAVKEFYPRKFALRKEDGITVELQKQQAFDIEELREASIAEAKNLARLDKLEGVVEVRDYFRENNTIYIVMEYIDGITLRDYLIKNGGRISVADAKKMIKPVMGSLIKVHNAGLIHRDISPDNIMITQSGQMKLIDFGTAKETEDGAAQAWGKGGYAPIEQYKRDGNQGPWTDVYALAATFYHCITGQKPPMAKERVNNDILVRPSLLGANISKEEEEALLIALAVDDSRRFRNMNALYNAFYEKETLVDQGMNQQVQYQQQMWQQQQYQQQMQYQQSQQATVETGKKKKSVMIPVMGAILCVFSIAIVVFVFIQPSGENGQDSLAVQETSESTEVVQEGEETDSYASVREQIQNSEYENAINSLLNDNFENADLTEEGKLLKEAIEGNLSDKIAEIDGDMNANSYPEALKTLDEVLEFRNELSQNAKASGYIDNQILDTKRDEIISRYREFVLSEGQNCAWNDNESGVDTLISTADNYLSGQEYEDIKAKVYSQLVLTHIDSFMKNGTKAIEAMNYIDSHLARTNNNCWVLEFWDYYREVYRVENSLPNMKAEISHVSPNGYLLDNSDKMLLTVDDISYLSQYELYLAKYEIYARHGRIFSDQAVNNYFQKYGWYSGNVAGADFDESVLNEYERKNRDLIIEYERTMNYR